MRQTKLVSLTLVTVGLSIVGCTTQQEVKEEARLEKEEQISIIGAPNGDQLPTVIITDKLPEAVQGSAPSAVLPSRFAATQSIYSSTFDRLAPSSHTYDPSNGTVSSGDIWRVKNGVPSGPLYWVSPNNSEQYSGDRYTRVDDVPFHFVSTTPLSTFSIDVDTASYGIMRRDLESGILPNKDAIRIEELVNYFDYSYPEPDNGDPFSVQTEVADCPWDTNHQLVRIALQGERIDIAQRPPSNTVFLLDVSGSMNDSRKLPLLQESLKLMVNELDHRDTISIVVYASSSGMVLPPTSGTQKDTIVKAINQLHAGGSTNGGAGIQLAYDTATANFVDGGINRVILATDGDFNVGPTGDGTLVDMVAEKAKGGVYLTVLGFGRGNLNDSMMEQITNKGNGNYAFIDSKSEAEKVLVEEMTGTMMTIAKDVKIQVEFNPAKVQAYRLVGYTNRVMANEDFNDDTKDAGEIGSGHNVTAFYEIVPPGIELPNPAPDELKYQTPEENVVASDELLTVKLRYKMPDSDTSTLIDHPVAATTASIDQASDDFIFAASVASFGMLLRNSEYAGFMSLEDVINLADIGAGSDERKREFIELVKKAKDIQLSKANN